MYTPEQRNIFEYHNGETKVYGDPLALRQEIFIETRGDPDSLPRRIFINLGRRLCLSCQSKLSRSESIPDDCEQCSYATPQELLDAKAAEKQLVELVRKVFEMKKFDPVTGKGATVENCLMTWKLFIRFLFSEKKNTVNSQTASTSSAGPPDSQTVTPSMSD